MKPTIHTPYHVEYRCGACQNRLRAAWKFCPLCGEPIDWKDYLTTLITNETDYAADRN